MKGSGAVPGSKEEDAPTQATTLKNTNRLNMFVVAYQEGATVFNRVMMVYQQEMSERIRSIALMESTELDKEFDPMSMGTPQGHWPYRKGRDTVVAYHDEETTCNTNMLRVNRTVHWGANKSRPGSKIREHTMKLQCLCLSSGLYNPEQKSASAPSARRASTEPVELEGELVVEKVNVTLTPTLSLPAVFRLFDSAVAEGLSASKATFDMSQFAEKEKAMKYEVHAKQIMAATRIPDYGDANRAKAEKELRMAGRNDKLLAKTRKMNPKEPASPSQQPRLGGVQTSPLTAATPLTPEASEQTGNGSSAGVGVGMGVVVGVGVSLDTDESHDKHVVLQPPFPSESTLPALLTGVVEVLLKMEWPYVLGESRGEQDVHLHLLEGEMFPRVAEIKEGCEWSKAGLPKDAVLLSVKYVNKDGIWSEQAPPFRNLPMVSWSDGPAANGHSSRDTRVRGQTDDLDEVQMRLSGDVGPELHDGGNGADAEWVPSQFALLCTVPNTISVLDALYNDPGVGGVDNGIRSGLVELPIANPSALDPSALQGSFDGRPAESSRGDPSSPPMSTARNNSRSSGVFSPDTQNGSWSSVPLGSDMGSMGGMLGLHPSSVLLGAGEAPESSSHGSMSTPTDGNSNPSCASPGGATVDMIRSTSNTSNVSNGYGYCKYCNIQLPQEVAEIDAHFVACVRLHERAAGKPKSWAKSRNLAQRIRANSPSWRSGRRQNSNSDFGPGQPGLSASLNAMSDEKSCMSFCFGPPNAENTGDGTSVMARSSSVPDIYSEGGSNRNVSSGSTRSSISLMRNDRGSTPSFTSVTSEEDGFEPKRSNSSDDLDNRGGGGSGEVSGSGGGGSFFAAPAAWEGSLAGTGVGGLNNSSMVQNPNWRKDNEVTKCQLCEKLFTMVVRKHHCRRCGQIFCETCSSNRLPLASGGLDLAGLSSPNPQGGGADSMGGSGGGSGRQKMRRVCDTCYAPVIYSVASVPCRGGRAIIHGENFSPPKAKIKPTTGKSKSGAVVNANGVAASDAVVVKTIHFGACSVDIPSVRNISVEVVIPSGVGESGIEVAVGRHKGRALFSYLPPVVREMKPTPPTEGGVVYLLGRNFGDSTVIALCEQERQASYPSAPKIIQVKVALPGAYAVGSPAPGFAPPLDCDVFHLCDELLKVVIPPGLGQDCILTVIVKGVESTSFSWSYQKPAITRSVFSNCTVCTVPCVLPRLHCCCGGPPSLLPAQFSPPQTIPTLTTQHSIYIHSHCTFCCARTLSLTLTVYRLLFDVMARVHSIPIDDDCLLDIEGRNFGSDSTKVQLMPIGHEKLLSPLPLETYTDENGLFATPAASRQSHNRLHFSLWDVADVHPPLVTGLPYPFTLRIGEDSLHGSFVFDLAATRLPQIQLDDGPFVEHPHYPLSEILRKVWWWRLQSVLFFCF
jgi:hypothetical protein